LPAGENVARAVEEHGKHNHPLRLFAVPRRFFTSLLRCIAAFLPLSFPFPATASQIPNQRILTAPIIPGRAARGER
jgi:hypothetical protein